MTVKQDNNNSSNNTSRTKQQHSTTMRMMGPAKDVGDNDGLDSDDDEEEDGDSSAKTPPALAFGNSRTSSSLGRRRSTAATAATKAQRSRGGRGGRRGVTNRFRRPRRSSSGGGGGGGKSSRQGDGRFDERSRGSGSGRTGYSSGGIRSTLDDDDPTAEYDDDESGGDDDYESGEDYDDDDDDESSSLNTGFMTNLGRGVMELERTVAGMMMGMPRHDEEEEELKRMVQSYDESFFNDTSSFNSQDRLFFQDLSGPEGEDESSVDVGLRRVRGGRAKIETAEAVGEAVEDGIDEEQQSTAQSWASSWLRLGRTVPATKPENDDPSSNPLPITPWSATTRIIVESKSNPNQDPVLRLGDVSFTSSDSNSREVPSLIRDVSMLNDEKTLQSRNRMEAAETVIQDDGDEDQNTEVDVQEFRRVTSLMLQQPTARSKEGEVQSTMQLDPPTQHGLTRSFSFMSPRKPSSNLHQISPLPSDPGASTFQTTNINNNKNNDDDNILIVRSRSWMGHVTTKPLKPAAGRETSIMRDNNSPRSSPFSLRNVNSKPSNSSRGSLPSMSPRLTPIISPTTSEVEVVVDSSRQSSYAPPASLDLPLLNKNYLSKSRQKKEVQATRKHASDANRSNDTSNDRSFDEGMPRMVLSTTTRATTIEPRTMNETERPPPLTHIVLSHHSKVDTITPDDIFAHDQELPPPSPTPIAMVHTPLSALSTNESIECGADDWTLTTTEEKEPCRRGIARSFSWFGRSNRSIDAKQDQDHHLDDLSSLPETLDQQQQQNCIEPPAVISSNESIEFSFEVAKKSFAGRRMGRAMRNRSNDKPIQPSSSVKSRKLVDVAASVPCEEPLEMEYEPDHERGTRQRKQKKVRVKKKKRMTGTCSQTVAASGSAKDSERQNASSSNSKATTKRENDDTLSLLPPTLSELRAAKSIKKPSGFTTFRKVKRSLSCSRRRPSDDFPPEARVATNHSVEIVGLPEKRKLRSSRVEPARMKEPKKSKSFKGVKKEKSAKAMSNEPRETADAVPSSDTTGGSLAPAKESNAWRDPPASDFVLSGFGGGMALHNFVQTAKEAVVGVQESVVQTAQDTVVGVQETVAGVIDDPFADKMKSVHVVERNNYLNKKDVHTPRHLSVSTSQHRASMLTMDGAVTSYKTEQKPRHDTDARAMQSTASLTDLHPYEPPSLANWQNGRFQPTPAVRLEESQVDKVKTTRSSGWLARKKIQDHAKRGSILFSQKGKEEDQRRSSNGGGGNRPVKKNQNDSTQHGKSRQPTKQAFQKNENFIIISHSDEPLPMVRISVETW